MNPARFQLEPCVPPVWARTGHRQTIFGHILASPPLPAGSEAVRIVLTDGDSLAARLYPGSSDTVILLFHGLGGTVDADYMRRTTLLAHGQGHTVLLVNHRGCGEGAGLARGIYHSGRSDDLGEVVRFARVRFVGKRLIAVGFSLSANALLLLLAGGRVGAPKLGADSHPDAAIAINAPINLARAGERLKQGWNRLYDFRFVQQCRRDIAYRKSAGLLKREYRVPPWVTLMDVDRLYTAPAGGFTDPAAYYSECSTRDRLDSIRVPTLLMTAADDPFIDVADYRVAKLSPAVHLHIESHGGHVGYLNGRPTPLGTRRWLDYAISVGIEAFKELSIRKPEPATGI